MNSRWTLGQTLRTWAAFPTPRILLALVLVVATARVWVGGWTVWDLVIPLAVIAFHPFTEWLIHVVLLHWRPRRVLGINIDTIAARDHRRHHSDPDDLPLIFIPLPTLLASAVLVPVAWLLLMPTLSLGLTGLLSTSVIAFGYEWVHFVCHVPYTPRNAWLRDRVRHHRLHHYKNENYWYGVTLHLADRVLRTLPDAADVPRSPTARDLEARA